ncbi:MAG: CheB methylesterase domain-containing protein [Planctomycetaceae bacterium]
MDGGTTCVAADFSALPQPFPVPVLLVQHISEGFIEGFMRWLGQMTGHPTTRHRQRGWSPASGWLPAGRHLALASRARIELPPPRLGYPLPVGKRVVRVAGAQGASSLGILLTGMGDDGASGLLTLKKAGGHTIIQNEASAMIWGMPKCAKELGAAKQELSPMEIVRVMMKAAGRISS